MNNRTTINPCKLRIIILALGSLTYNYRLDSCSASGCVYVQVCVCVAQQLDEQNRTCGSVNSGKIKKTLDL